MPLPWRPCGAPKKRSQNGCLQNNKESLQYDGRFFFSSSFVLVVDFYSIVNIMSPDGSGCLYCTKLLWHWKSFLYKQSTNNMLP